MSSQFHLENFGKSRCALHLAKRVLSVFFIILVCCLGVKAAGAGAAPAVSFSPTIDNFGNQAIGTTNYDQAVELYNTGNAALSIHNIALTGTNASDFWQANDCGSSVAARGQCTINVSFTPAAIGTRTAALTFTDNATGSPQSVTLIGTGISHGPIASLSPTSLTFANQAVSTTSSAHTITLNNTGSAALTLTSITLSGANPGDFAQSNNCGSSVVAGANCTISVTFKPTASGTRTAAV
ncbi:MAG: choice-of-anchor D domain-containing protein, partial [Terriglobia bacterium]